MLNKVESKLMNHIFEKCRGKQTMLISPDELLRCLLPKHELTKKQLAAALKNIALDGYIDVLNSDNKGSLVYIISLKSKGEIWKREQEEAHIKRMRSIYWTIAIGIVSGVVSIAFFLLRKAIFG